ncbi:hypothetical protein L484_016689 [Morus notabilis]|uniref:Uncharacterized protein n=1 Tax=Morus notabilis TaxID=981085 RepID=W9RP46_9ROSA|nr:hypothetical protein L484_016689 [Morus notabilis]
MSARLRDHRRLTTRSLLKDSNVPGDHGHFLCRIWFKVPPEIVQMMALSTSLPKQKSKFSGVDGGPLSTWRKPSSSLLCSIIMIKKKTQEASPVFLSRRLPRKHRDLEVAA